MYDVLIAGGGPAGLTAGIYLARAGFKPVVFERSFAGGQMAISSTIENYPGYNEDIPGAVLANAMKQQTLRMGCEILAEDITAMELKGDIKKFKTNKGEYEAPAVILAMGAVPRHTGVDGEDRLIGSGVSFCATCDGNFFKDRPVAIIGGGNTALEDALFMAKLCPKVYLIHRRDQLRGQHKLIETVRGLPNVEILTPYVPEKIEGKFAVDKLIIKEVQTGGKKELDVAGVFMAVGQIPKTELVKDVLDLDSTGYIIADESCKTNIRGVFCAGDVRTKSVRQIVTATADGAVASIAAEEYLLATDEERKSK